MVKNRFVVEVADTVTLKNCVTRLRNVDSVFDAYRVTPGRLDELAARRPTRSAPGCDRGTPASVEVARCSRRRPGRGSTCRAPADRIERGDAGVASTLGKLVDLAVAG